MKSHALIPVALALPISLIFGLLMFSAVEEAQSCSTPSTSAVDVGAIPEGPIAGYSGQQLANAAVIMGVARQRGLSRRDQQIGIMTAMGESSLRNVDHGDSARADTIGLFQIGPEHGTRAQRLDTSWSAGNFYDRLQSISRYQDLEPTIAAHRAQRNADPYFYERFWSPAETVVQALAAESTMVSVANTQGTGDYNLGQVQPQLRVLVTVLAPMFEIDTVGGFRSSAVDPGGHPAGLAADFMVPLTAGGRAQGDALAAYAQAHAAELRVDYVMWQQRIWSVERAAEGWRPLTDRGSDTANHQDHVHINVLSNGANSSAEGNEATQTANQECPSLVAGGTWVAPLGDEAPINSPFGWRTHPLTGARSFHDGVDYGAGCGTEAQAASNGIVISAGEDPIYGHQIVVEHAGGILTRYGHMYASGVLVAVGDQVATGQIIAQVGSDGWSTGCHLHFTVIVDGEPVDPVEFLANPPATDGIGAGLTIAHANIKFDMPTGHFLQDRDQLASSNPDFLSFNEAGFRSNAELAPPGYAVFRAAPTLPTGQTRSTAVAWRTDRWTRADGGRTLLVDGGPQRTDAGRSATWATLQNRDGGTVSVVSVHQMINPHRYGPNILRRREIYAQGMRRLQALVLTLSTSGPVFVAGDFNSQYTDDDPWGPRSMLGEIGMRATFQDFGPTATHDGGGTIDYVFYLPAKAKAAGQSTHGLHSDHHALIAQFTTGQE